MRLCATRINQPPAEMQISSLPLPQKGIFIHVKVVNTSLGHQIIPLGEIASEHYTTNIYVRELPEKRLDACCSWWVGGKKSIYKSLCFRTKRISYEEVRGSMICFSHGSVVATYLLKRVREAFWVARK